MNDIEKLIEQRKKAGIKRPLRKPLKWHFPNQIEKEYADFTKKQAQKFKDLFERLVAPQLKNLYEESQSIRPDSMTRHDNWAATIALLLSQVETQWDREFAREVPQIRELANKTSDFNDKEFRRVVNSVVGVNPLRSEPWLAPQLELYFRENVRLIKNIAEDLTTQVEGIIARGFSQGLRFEEIASQLNDRFDIGERRAVNVARDQVQRLNSNLTELRQKEVGLRKFEWSTAGDERVRPEHAARDGKVYEWSNAPEKPGQAINCRCVALPIFEDLT